MDSSSDAIWTAAVTQAGDLIAQAQDLLDQAYALVEGQPPAPSGPQVYVKAGVVAVSARRGSGSKVKVAPTPLPVTSPLCGISTGSKINGKPADWVWELDSCASLGAGGLCRIDYHGSAQDWLVQEILNRGMSPLLLIGGTYNTGIPTPAVHAQAVTAALTKWKGHVIVVAVGGNEPNINGQTPQVNAGLIKAGYQAAKAVDSHVQVATGGLAPAPSTHPLGDTLTYALQLIPLIRGYCDHFDVHLYEGAYVLGAWNNWSRCYDPQVLGGRQSIRQCLDANGMAAVPICATESGGNVNQSSPLVTGGPKQVIGESGQAQFVGDAYRRAQQLRSQGDMSFLLTYTMRDNDVAGFGLSRLDHSHRPSWAVAASAFASAT